MYRLDIILKAVILAVVCLSACGEDDEARSGRDCRDVGACRVVRSDFKAVRNDGWRTTGPGCEVQGENLTVVAPCSPGWHFIAPRQFLSGFSLYRAQFSFRLETSFQSQSTHAEQPCTVFDGYRVIVSDSGAGTGAGSRTLGVRLGRERSESADFTVTFDADTTWEDVSTGTASNAAEIESVMRRASSLLLGSGCAFPIAPSHSLASSRFKTGSLTDGKSGRKGKEERERAGGRGREEESGVMVTRLSHPTLRLHPEAGIDSKKREGGVERRGKADASPREQRSRSREKEEDDSGERKEQPRREEEDREKKETERGERNAAVRGEEADRHVKEERSECEARFKAKDWKGADACFQEWMKRRRRKGGGTGEGAGEAEATRRREAQHAREEEGDEDEEGQVGGEGLCWALVNSVRAALLARKPNKTDAIAPLLEALSATKHAPRSMDTGWIACVGWAARTMADVHFRDQDYGNAAKAYERALKMGLNNSIMEAVTYSDVAAAQHLGGTSAHTVSSNYQKALKLLPELQVFHVIGAMGTTSYGAEARTTIEQHLKTLSKVPPSAQREEWGIELAALLNQSPACAKPAPKTVVFFCRLRGQTPLPGSVLRIGYAMPGVCYATPGTVLGHSARHLLCEVQYSHEMPHAGVGGSEEAATYLSRELANKGYCVRVYGNPMVEEWGVDQYGVVWLPFFAYHLQQPADVFIVWRNWDAVWMSPRATRRFLWVHDPLSLASDQDYYTPSYLAALSGIFVLSSHSASQFPPQAQAKLLATRNGLPPHLLRDGRNAHHKLLYSSWPSSGLEQILLAWPQIRAGAPSAELHVYYGFDMWWATPLYKHEPWFIKWRGQMEAMLAQDGVLYKGGVGHARMAEAYAETGFYLYPTDTQETAPINLIKAQANGCIPITSRYPKSAIPETTAEFDLGPPARSGVIKEDPAWMQEWTQAVIDAVNTPHHHLREHRRRMKESARAKYNWTRVAEDWHVHLTG